RKYFEEKPETVKQIIELSNIEHKEKKKDEDIIIDFFKKVFEEIEESSFKNFIIYSPENTSLRTFEKEGQIEPLGIYGEGLFKLLKYFKSDEKEKLETIKKYLNFFGWFEDLTIPDNLFEGESYLKIKDKFIDKNVDFFDQRSSNEGFLFILFYCSLLISKKTPDFFAIDNIESSLNPKLTTKLIKCLTELSKENNKQIILTTHSPSALDGLDLNDDEQKLFLVYRNNKGYTSIKEIEKPKQIEGQEPIKLSEAFLRGYLGGLPKNFSL
ncbi:MAG TPA: AAA family ATPase, partial [Flavobacterium sp.]|nr:AAA family ATPase [Flavobacterium sp.]